MLTSFYPEGETAEKLALIASTTQPQKQGRPRRFQINIPKVEAYFTGTGRCHLAMTTHDRLVRRQITYQASLAQA